MAETDSYLPIVVPRVVEGQICDHLQWTFYFQLATRCGQQHTNGSVFGSFLIG